MADLQEENCSWSGGSKYIFYLLHIEVTIINNNIKCQYDLRIIGINIKSIKYYWKLFSKNLNCFWQKKEMLCRLKDGESILEFKLDAKIQSYFPNVFERGKFNSDSVYTRRSCLLEVMKWSRPYLWKIYYYIYY